MIVRSHAVLTNLRFRRPCRLAVIHSRRMKLQGLLKCAPYDFVSLSSCALVKFVDIRPVKFTGCRKLVWDKLLRPLLWALVYP